MESGLKNNNSIVKDPLFSATTALGEGDGDPVEGPDQPRECKYLAIL